MKLPFLHFSMIFEVYTSYTDILAIQRILQFLPLGQDPNQISQIYFQDYLNE